MNRSPLGSMLVAAGVITALPAHADAQLVVQVGLSFEWSDGAWRAYRPAYETSRREVYYSGRREAVFYTQRRAFRVPRGHLPPPGFCRVWYPGRPPGRQPAPRPCEVLLRMHRQPGAVIIGTPAFVGQAVFAYGDRELRSRDDRDFRDRRRVRFDDDDDRGFRFDDDDRGFRFDDDDRGFRFDDDRFRVVEGARGLRLVADNDGFRGGQDRRGRR